MCTKKQSIAQLKCLNVFICKTLFEVTLISREKIVLIKIIKQTYRQKIWRVFNFNVQYYEHINTIDYETNIDVRGK